MKVGDCTIESKGRAIKPVLAFRERLLKTVYVGFMYVALFVTCINLIKHL